MSYEIIDNKIPVSQKNLTIMQIKCARYTMHKPVLELRKASRKLILQKPQMLMWLNDAFTEAQFSL